MTCRVCNKKTYFLISPCSCDGYVHASCLESDVCPTCSEKYLLPSPIAWIPYACAWSFALVHGYLDHTDSVIPILPRTLIVFFCQLVYISLILWAEKMHGWMLPLLPMICMFIYFTIVVYYRQFWWYTILQTYLFFMQTALCWASSGCRSKGRQAPPSN